MKVIRNNMARAMLIAFLLFAILGSFFAFQEANAQTTNYVYGSIASSSSVIIAHGSVTVTCTYTSTTNVNGTGYLWLSGPYSDPTDPDAFDAYSKVYSWDGQTTRANHGSNLTSGVPVTYTRVLDTSGYYKFKWECGSTDGAYTWVLVRVVDTPTVLPEASPIAAVTVGFVAIGLFVVGAKKRNAEISAKIF